MTHLDVTRNRIAEDGGQSLLDAIQSTMRIVDCKITYGNLISNKMGRIFQREMKANIQANASMAAQIGNSALGLSEA